MFGANDGEYGSPRVHAELIDRPELRGLSVNTVADRMQSLGLVGKKQDRRRSLTRPDPHAPKFENLVRRKFNPAVPNEIWCGDIERHEALTNRAVMKGHRRVLVAASAMKLRAA